MSGARKSHTEAMFATRLTHTASGGGIVIAAKTLDGVKRALNMLSPDPFDRSKVKRVTVACREKCCVVTK